MKRIISLIIVLSVIFSSVLFVNAAGKTAVDVEEAYGLLQALSVIDKDFASDSTPITRAEFTALTVKAAGFAPYVAQEVSAAPFSDVAKDAPYASYIAMAKERKISLGYTDGSFRPEEKISLMEAVVYLIRILGYTDIAEEKGGYPGGYQTEAYSLDLLDGISDSFTSTVTKEYAVKLLFNALNTRVLVLNSYGDKDSFSIDYGNYLMYESMNVEKVEGIMDEVDISALVGPNELSPYTISINRVLIDVGTLSPNYLLGYNVTAYYKNENGKNVLVYVTPDKEKNTVKTAEISEISEIANQVVTCVDSEGETTKIRYEKGAAILYNGVATKSFFNTSIYLDENGAKLSGYIDFLDNNGDGVADVVFVNAYEEYIAGKKDAGSKILYDKNDPSHKIVLDTTTNDPYTIIFNEAGEEIQLTAVKTGASVVVMRSKPDAYQGYIKVYVSVKTVSGVLEGTDEKDGAKVVIIDGKEYPMSNYAVKYYNANLYGKNITAVINTYGEVAFIDDSSAVEKTGLLKGVKIATAEYESSMFYIYSENGENLEIEPAKWIKLDGRPNPYSSSSTADMNTLKGILDMVASQYTVAPDGSNKMNLVIQYTVNEDGKLTSIDTAYDKEGNPASRSKMEPGDSLVALKITESDICIRNTYNNIIGKKIIIDKVSKVFLYPEDDSSEGYWISTADKVFNNLGTYDAVAYYTDKDSVSPSAYVMSEDSPTYFHTSSSGYMSMILKVTDTKNDEGLPAKKIYMYHNNELVTYYSDANTKCECNSSSCGGFKVSDLAAGDIIYAGINKISSELEKFYIRYDNSAKMIYHNDNVTGTTNRKGQRLTMAYPYLATSQGVHYVDMAESGKDAVSVDVSGINTSTVESLYNNGNFHVADYAAGVPITIFDTNKKGDYVVSPGTADDILSYLEVQDSCSKLIIHAYAQNSYTLVRGIYIIREGQR